MPSPPRPPHPAPDRLDFASIAEAFAQSPAFMCVLRGADHVFSFANEQYFRLIGRRDILGRPAREALPEVAGQGFFELLDRVYETGERFVGQHRRIELRRGPGQPAEVRFVEFVYQPMRDAGGAVQGIFVHGVDVTEHRLTTLAAQASEERLRLVLESSTDYAIFTVDPAGRITTWNHGAERVFGWADAEVIGRDAAMLWDVADRVSGAVASFLAAARERGRAEDERWRPHRSGRRFYASAVASPMHDGEGTLVGYTMICHDVTDRWLAAERLRESEERFRQLADAMPQIVFAADRDGHVDYFNRRWYEYTGLPEGSVGYEHWQHVHEPEALERTVAVWSEALRTGQMYEIEYRLRRADGVFRWHLGRALPVRNDRGEIVRWFGTNTDIHDQKELQAQNEQLLGSERAARSEAERVNRLKDEFLATLGHELRTPLNAILGWSQLLRGGRMGEAEIAKGLETIERNARAQSQIIGDLLDMSRIISGKVRLDVQRLDPASALQNAVETVRPTAEAKGVRLRAMLDPAAGPVAGDLNRLQQVFWNLLTNAIKFTPRDGQVEVRLRRVESHVEIAVADTGAGIKPDFLPYVFDRFRQADGSTTRSHDGLGLGLAIVKHLVELHGGTISVRSPGPGRGSTFTIQLPVAVIPAPAQEGRGPHDPEPTPATLAIDLCPKLNGVRVLVVDDEPDARLLVRRLLEDCNAVVRTAGSAAEAIAALEEERPDVLVSDIGMPDEDGYTLIRRVRARGADRGGDVPALALTAYVRAEDRVRSILAGFQMHLSKPVEPTELITMIGSLAGRT